MSGLSVRWKLTLWYGVVIAGVLTIFSAAVYLLFRHEMLSSIDDGLEEELSDVLAEVHRADDEPSLIHWLERRFAHHAGFDFQINRSDGTPFFVSERLKDPALPIPSQEDLSDMPRLRTVDTANGLRRRIISVLTQGPHVALTIQIGRTLDELAEESRELLLTFLLMGPLVLSIVVGSGYLLARRALAPVDAMARSANRISVDRLNERLDVINPHDELGKLALTLNDMIERLQRSFAEMQRFTADAAHELRTPLAVIRSETEIALRSARSPEEYANVLGSVLEEINRLADVADQLLFLSRQDAQLHVALRKEVATEELLQEVVANMQLVAQEKGVSLILESSPVCRLKSDAAGLRRVFYNLLDNSVKYTPAGGRIKVSVLVDAVQWRVDISDTGVGIPAEHLPHVFERFYRADPARTGGNGSGLGLAICCSILQGLGGTIDLEITLDAGTTVRVVLPREM